MSLPAASSEIVEPSAWKKWLKPIFSGEVLRRRKVLPNAPRLVTLNDDNRGKGYKRNFTRTTKYTILTYLPKSLFEQVWSGLHARASCMSFEAMN